MDWTFTGEVIEWRGPAPYLFVAMTPQDSADLKEEARGLIYWGQVPVHVRIGDTEFTTALFPKDGRYLVPSRWLYSEPRGSGPVQDRAQCVGHRMVLALGERQGHPVPLFSPPRHGGLAGYEDRPRVCDGSVDRLRRGLPQRVSWG